MWLLLFLAAVNAFLFYFITGIRRYLDFKVATNLDYWSEGEIEFPSVTICNYNLARKSYFADHPDPFYSSVLDFMDPFTPSDLNITDPEVISKLRRIYSTEFGFKSGHQRDMFVSCDFHSNNQTKPCQFPDDLFKKRRTRMGGCFTFQPMEFVERNGQYNTTRAGMNGGLYLRVNVQQQEYNLGTLGAGIKASKVARFVKKMA